MSDFDSMEEMLGLSSVRLDDRPKKKFSPWHRPRKQFIRRHQWLTSIEELLARIKPENQLFSYLSLPGDDFLDVRFLHDELCAPQGLELRYLGFNSSLNGKTQTPDSNTAEFSVRRLENVSTDIRIIPDRIESVAVENSMAQKALHQGSAFHAINIDLCDGIASGRKSGENPDMLTALRVLLEVQSRANHESVLFLTTRVDSDEVSEGVRQVFKEAHESTLKDCSGYRNEHQKFWSEGHLAHKVDAVDAADEDEVILGLSQWIIHACADLRLDAVLTTVYTYRVNSESKNDDMISIAVTLKPNRTIPPNALLTPQATLNSIDTEIAAQHRAPEVSETASDLAISLEPRTCFLAQPVPGRVRLRKSVDYKLTNDLSLAQLCMLESQQLLTEAGYDSRAYQEWLASQA